MSTLLDFALKRLEEWGNYSNISTLLVEEFNRCKDIKHEVAIFADLAENVRKNKDKPRVRLDFITAMHNASIRARAAFLTSPDNADLKEIFDSDLGGTKAAKDILQDVQKAGEQIIFRTKRTAKFFGIVKDIEEEQKDVAKKAQKERTEAADAFNTTFEQLLKDDKEYQQLLSRRTEIAQQLKDLDLDSQEARILLSEAQDLLVKQEAKQKQLRAFAKFATELHEKISFVSKNVEQEKENYEKIVKEVCNDIVDGLLEVSPITEEEAQKYVNEKLEFAASFESRWGEDGKKVVRNEVAKIYRLSGGNLGTLLFSAVRDDRSYAEKKDHSVNLGPCFVDSEKFKRHLWHEVGHHVEFCTPELFSVAHEYIKTRASGGVMPLKKITNMNYGAEELGYPNDFVCSYTGKIYTDSSEIYSMGLEALAGGMEGETAFISDTGHIAFIAGAMSNIQSNYATKINEARDVNNVRPWNLAVQDREFESDWEKAIEEVITPEFKSFVLKKKKVGSFTIKLMGDGDYDIKYRKTKVFPAQIYQSQRMTLILMYQAACIQQGLFPGIAHPMQFVAEGKIPTWFYPGVKLPSPQLM